MGCSVAPTESGKQGKFSEGTAAILSKTARFKTVTGTYRETYRYQS
jgi:hypothetical protein